MLPHASPCYTSHGCNNPGFNKLILNSSEGFPDPWVPVPLLESRGDVALLDMNMIHRGGTRGHSVVAYTGFAGISTQSINLDNTCPVTPPLWAPRTQAHPTHCGHCQAVATEKCVTCERLCLCEQFGCLILNHPDWGYFTP